MLSSGYWDTWLSERIDGFCLKDGIEQNDDNPRYQADVRGISPFGWWAYFEDERVKFYCVWVKTHKKNCQRLVGKLTIAYHSSGSFNNYVLYNRWTKPHKLFSPNK